ncbi:hypothetical protein PYW08_015164 [Mythimna loreyi]|uniref:Uncharacterized protein n=1 Tax=Mythimna loreyi TaxID=667449 RepID=A0ACC2QVZ4_9NEOP|nr:hypothetical protein PYW08_015164 [Mythimna loreyi]
MNTIICVSLHSVDTSGCDTILRWYINDHTGGNELFRQKSSVMASARVTRTTLSVVTKFLLITLFCCKCSSEEVNDRYYPRYHLAPEHGWMNDPNGFSKFQDEYHLFFQYNPESSQEPGIAHWAHAKSPDLFTWEHLPIAMYPDESYDKQGVFSGSAIIENNTMYLYYTGNVKNPSQQFQALASSTDGVHVEKYAGNPVIKAEDYQPNIRDPKVWKHGDRYYMVLGNSFNNDTLGRVLLYSSKDGISWEEESILGESDGPMGYMWECPDFFELDGYHILLFSPQGLKPEGDKYRNLYQTGYIVGHFDYQTHCFKHVTKFVELDHGHDFYATQTILDDDGRRIVIAWFDMWEQKYPERDDGWTGQMTIPRVLSLTKELKLIQKPVEEISAARCSTIYSGKPRGGHTVQLIDKAAEIKITASRDQDFIAYIESTNTNVSISYDKQENKVTLDRGGEDGIRRTDWEPTRDINYFIYVDASSIEVFLGEGEVTFSSRFFPTDDVTFRLGDDVKVDTMTVTAMKRTVEMP